MTKEYSIAVYRYGLRPPLNWDADCDREMQLMNRLWNNLVEIDRDCARKYREIRAGYPELAAAEERVKSLAEAMDRVKSEIKAARARKRSKKYAECGDAPERLRALREAYAEAKAREKELRGPATETMKPQLAALEEERKARVKEARQNSGLYWCNYNAVIASFDTARSKALREKTELRFHRHDGSGRMTAQIIGGLPLAGLLTGESNQLRLRAPESYRRGKNHGQVEMAIYSRDRKPHRIVWPIVMHRPIPNGAIIQEATITRRRTGQKWKSAEWEWSISFLCRVPQEEPAQTQSGYCGIDVGWRLLNSGLRVAVIATRKLAGEQASIENFILPEKDAERREKRHEGFLADEAYMRDLQAKIGNRNNGIAQRLKDAGIASMPSGDPEGPLARAISALIHSPVIHVRMLAQLAEAWTNQNPDWNPDLLKDLRRIVYQNARDWGEIRARKNGLIRRRKDLYRNLAARLAKKYKVIAVEAVDWAIAYKNSTLPAPAVTLRGLAAPGELLACIKQAAKKYGARIIEHEGVSTWKCHGCGTMFEPKDKTQLIQTCPHCGLSWDQDRNAALNLLAEAESAGSAPPDPGTPLEKEKNEKIQEVKETRWGRARRLRAEKEAAQKGA